MSKVYPIIKNINKPISIWLGKRIEGFQEDIILECPSCGYKMNLTSDSASFEYGELFSPDECWNCGEEFENIEFEAEATVTIKIKKGE